MAVIDEVFGKLFSTSEIALSRKPWKKAVLILENFNVSVLGERQALAILCEIINHVDFPKDELKKFFSRRAADKIREILGLNDYYEIDGTETNDIQMYLDRGESIAEIGSHWSFRNPQT